MIDEAITLKIDSLDKLTEHWIAEGAKQERERILGLRKEIINCVVDYGLVGESYLRAMRDLEAVIKGEQK